MSPTTDDQTTTPRRVETPPDPEQTAQPQNRGASTIHAVPDVHDQAYGTEELPHNDDDEPDWILPADRFAVGYPDGDPWQAGLILDIETDEGLLGRVVLPLNPGNLGTIMRGLHNVAEAQGADLAESDAVEDEQQDPEEDDAEYRRTIAERADPLGFRQIIDTRLGRWIVVGVIGLLLVVLLLNKLFS